MNNNRYIVVHKHYYGGGGIGDFIRASLSFYSICKRNNFEYYIDFSVNKLLKKCFNYKKLQKEIKNSNFYKIKIKFFEEELIFV